MSSARESVREMFGRLGESLLTHVAGSLETDRSVDDVVIQSPGEPVVVTTGSVVFGVGVKHSPHSVSWLLRELGAVGAAALVLRAPVQPGGLIEQAASESRVPLLTLVEGAAWMYLADMIRPVRGWREEDSVVTEASLSADLNLFKVANSLAEVLDAPVTIEDLRSRVLAFSDDQERGDDVRKSAVLGQQVPHDIGAELVQLGVFQRLYSSDIPIWVDSLPGDIRARMAVPIRAGDALLGSIWAIAEEPLGAAQAQAMVLAANTAAAAILQGRVAGDAVQRMRTATVTALIGGGQPARSVAEKVHRARLRGGCVVAARMRTSGSSAGSASVDRLASSLVMALRGECTAAVAAVLHDTVYAVMLQSAGFYVDVRSVQRLLQSFVRRRGHDLDGLIVGVGHTVSDPADLDRSREDAELVLRVLDTPATADPGALHVATREDVRVPSLVLRLSDIAATDPVSCDGPLTRLEEYDCEHQTNLATTLECWLEQFGDVTGTASLLNVHTNTLRYRLRRIEEVGSVDLGDAEERFELMLRFRIRHSLGETETSPPHLCPANPVSSAAQLLAPPRTQ